MQILVLSYSQTGDSTRVAQAISAPLRDAGHTVTHEFLRPTISYPFPWHSPLRFFNVLPECLLGPPPVMEPVSFDVTANYDLIVLVYQVWFLSPSLPIQGFLASPAAAVLRGRKLITVAVSRNMWQSASERMKKLVRAAGAIHLDNVVVTHQGPAWATFITTPRALLSGKTGRFLKVFPPAGIGSRELDRVHRFGEIIRDSFPQRESDDTSPLLNGVGAVRIDYPYMVPEAVGWYVFTAWAYVLKALGRCAGWLRSLGVCCFMIFLVCIVIVGIPLVALITLLLMPIIWKPFRAYAERLAEPSGMGIGGRRPLAFSGVTDDGVCRIPD